MRVTVRVVELSIVGVPFSVCGIAGVLRKMFLDARVLR